LPHGEDGDHRRGGDEEREGAGGDGGSPELYDRERRVRGRTPAEIVGALALLAGVLR
jgi:hypothetical protein